MYAISVLVSAPRADALRGLYDTVTLLTPLLRNIDHTDLEGSKKFLLADAKLHADRHRAMLNAAFRRLARQQTQFDPSVSPWDLSAIK